MRTRLDSKNPQEPGERVLRIGTRASQLAQWQAKWVATALSHLGVCVEIVNITTKGDANQQGPLSQLGSQGLFTKEIQAALLRDEVDVAVHSLKDLPTETIEGLVLAAVPIREQSGDALVSVEFSSLDDLELGATVGTGSRRRQAQLRQLRPDLQLMDIRGNLDTRLAKLDAGNYDAIVLAIAGLRRMGLESRIVEQLGPPRMLPAAGQGALGIECRVKDRMVRNVLAQIDDPPSHQSVSAERMLLAALEAGCLAPVGAWGRMEGETLCLDAVVASLDGKQCYRAAGKGSDPDILGEQVAAQLQQQGADEIIQDSRKQ